MPTEHCILTNTPLVTMQSWQAAIDREGYSIRLELDPPDIPRNGPVHLEIDGTPTSFLICTLPFVHAIRQRNRDKVPELWPEVISMREIGGMVSGFAATLAVIAYAVASGGTLYDPSSDDGIIDLEKIRSEFQVLRGVSLDQLGLTTEPIP